MQQEEMKNVGEQTGKGKILMENSLTNSRNMITITKSASVEFDLDKKGEPTIWLVAGSTFLLNHDDICG